jgi:hypothetical protein
MHACREGGDCLEVYVWLVRQEGDDGLFTGKFLPTQKLVLPWSTKGFANLSKFTCILYSLSYRNIRI